jgi:hypothetical protein
MTPNEFELKYGIGLQEGDTVRGTARIDRHYWRTVTGKVDLVGTNFVAVLGGYNVPIDCIYSVNGEEVER